MELKLSHKIIVINSKGKVLNKRSIIGSIDWSIEYLLINNRPIISEYES